MIHQDYKEMLPAHALAALDAADELVLIEHLSGCAECRRELDDWQETTAVLAVTTDQVEPSAKVRERVLSQIQIINTEASPSNVVPFIPPQKNLWRSFGSLGQIAAALIVTALVVYVALLWKENRALRTQIEIVSSEIKSIRQDLNLKEEAIRLVSSPGSRMAELNATPMAPGATAKLAFDKTGHAMLLAQGLPAAPAGKEYQLWFIVGGQKLPGKTFSTAVDGSGLLIDQVPSAAMNSAVFAITVEPKGGVTVPTGQIYLVSSS